MFKQGLYIKPLADFPAQHSKHVAPCINSQLGRKRPGSAGGLENVGFQTCTTERTAYNSKMHK